MACPHGEPQAPANCGTGTDLQRQGQHFTFPAPLCSASAKICGCVFDGKCSAPTRLSAQAHFCTRLWTLGVRYRATLKNCRTSSTDCCTTMVFRRCILHSHRTRCPFWFTAHKAAPTDKRYSKLQVCQSAAAAAALGQHGETNSLSLGQHPGKQTPCSPDCALLMRLPDCCEPPATHSQQGGKVQAGRHSVPDLHQAMTQSGFWVFLPITAAVSGGRIDQTSCATEQNHLENGVTQCSTVIL